MLKRMLLVAAGLAMCGQAYAITYGQYQAAESEPGSVAAGAMGMYLVGANCRSSDDQCLRKDFRSWGAFLPAR